MRRLVSAALLVALCGLVLSWSGAAAPPPLRIDVSSPVEATSTSGASVTYHVKAYDSADPIAATCTGGSGSGDFDVTVTLPIGPNTIHCDATLGDGSAVSGEESITVQDTIPPTFSSVTTVNASTTDPKGVAVNYDVPTSTDLGESLTVTCIPAPGSMFVVGTTQVDCSASDGRGNTGHAFFNVVVTLIDNDAPTFTPPLPTSSTTEATGPSGAAVAWAIAATDNADPTPTINCDHASGSTFPIATTTVTCTASDDSGNTSAPATFDVIVVDTTPPTLSLPGNQQVETENPAGTAATYSASASDIVAGSISPNCSPASGAAFPIGTTTVNCSADDGHGHTTSGSFAVTVTLVDHTAPTFTGISGDRQVEANGPGGSVVNYPLPTASDSLDGPIAGVGCSPPSGSTFPLGATTVTCNATDAHGNLGSATFQIRVVDTVPPTLVVPAPRSVYATSASGVSDSDSAVVDFLSAASADDLVDSNPIVRTDIHSTLPVGVTPITFFAHDASGNTSSKEVLLTVLPQPPAGTPPLPVPPAPRAPADVRNLTITPLDSAVRLRWQTPAGVDHVVITRAPSAGGARQVIYSGSAATFVDRGLLNGTEYRYVLATVDSAGNSSAGVAAVAVPRRNLLRSPKDGARLRKPPKLIWAADGEADYYNAQLLRNNVKILSVWPTKAAFALQKSWKFEGRKYTLTPGVYRWYVWPGFGARSLVDYGELLGSRSFQIVR